MKKAVAYTFIFNNQIFVSEDKKAEQNKTLSGLVSICVLFKKLEIRTDDWGTNYSENISELKKSRFYCSTVWAGTSKENLHKLQLY